MKNPEIIIKQINVRKKMIRYNQNRLSNIQQQARDYLPFFGAESPLGER